MSVVVQSVYIVVLIILGLYLANIILMPPCRGGFDSVGIFEPMYDTDRVYNLRDIEPVLIVKEKQKTLLDVLKSLQNNMGNTSTINNDAIAIKK